MRTLLKTFSLHQQHNLNDGARPSLGQSSHLRGSENPKIRNCPKKAKTPGVFAFFADVVSTWRGSCTELSLKMVSYVENIKLCIASSFQRKFTSLELGKRPKGKMAGAKKKHLRKKFKNPTFRKAIRFS